MSIIDSLNWRYATTKFDRNKKIPDSDILKLKEIVKLSPSSWGRLLMNVQISGHSLKVVHEKDIDQMIDQFHILRSNDKDYSKESIENYSNEVKKSVLGMNKHKQSEWLKKQCYIALGQLMVGCADMRIDSCPMEGFKSNEFDEILDLSSQNLTSVVLLPVGYRSEEDKYQHKTKVRKPNNLLFVDD